MSDRNCEHFLETSQKVDISHFEISFDCLISEIKEAGTLSKAHQNGSTSN